MDELEDLVLEAYDEEGNCCVKQLHKKILRTGVWPVVVFHYKERNKETGLLSDEKVMIQRFQKKNQQYKPYNKVILNNREEIHDLLNVLNTWFKEESKDND